MTRVPSLPGSLRNRTFFDSVFRQGTMSDGQGRSVGNYSKGEQKRPCASARQMTNSIVNRRVGFHLLT
jgi:hypothetical protein